MKILVSPIDAQNVPNILVAHAVKPDKLILLVSKRMEDHARWFIKALACGGLDYKTRCEQIRIEDTESIDQMKSVLQGLYDINAGAEWAVNLTSGKKPLCMGAYEFFKGKDANMLYIYDDDQTQAIDFSGKPSMDLCHKVSIVEFMAGYDFDLLNFASLKKAEIGAYGWFELAAMMAFYQDESSLKHFLSDLLYLSGQRDGRNKGMELRKADQVILRKDELLNKVSNLFTLKIDGSVLYGALDKYAVRFFTGGWLTVFIWGLLKRLDGDLIWDLHMGVSFGKKGRPFDKVHNEWDVVFMKNQSLYTIECKTGEQKQDPTGNETLYKIEAIKSLFGAIRIPSYLITTAPNVLDEKGDVKEHIANRAQIYDCKVITGDVIQRLATLELTKDRKLPEEICKVFELNYSA